MSQLELITIFIFQVIVYSIPLLYGTVGEIITEKSGSLNLGVEGTMAMGAVMGYYAAVVSDSLFVGILVAFLFSGLAGLIFSFLTITLQANQNVTGLAITTFGVGLHFVLGEKFKVIYATTPIPKLTKLLSDIDMGPLSDIPVIGKILFSQNILVYLGIFTAILAWVYLKYTKRGLHLRSIGENPAAADAVGINVNLQKYIHIIVGSGIMGVGGLYMAAIVRSGSWSGADWIAGYGWISIALVIFANWSPARAIFGTFLFGIFNCIYNYSGNFAAAVPWLGWLKQIPSEVYDMLPFVITALVLIITSIRKKKSNKQPAAMGLNYFREDR